MLDAILLLNHYATFKELSRCPLGLKFSPAARGNDTSQALPCQGFYEKRSGIIANAMELR
jgi:hypothetical protein